MIDISKHLNEDLIIHDLGKCSREEAIRALVGKVYSREGHLFFSV